MSRSDPAGGGRRLHVSQAAGAALRVALVVVLVAAVAGLLAPAQYRTPLGSLALRLTPAWPGGRVVMPLGPAGELALHTHRTPVDIVMDYRLPATDASLDAGGTVLAGLEHDARSAFVHFVASRVPWALLAGAAAGALVVASWRSWRRLLVGAAAGTIAAGTLAGGFGVVTYLTVDRSPAVEYHGLASSVPRVLPLLRALGSGSAGDHLRGLQDYIDGLQQVALQLETAPQRPQRANVTRLLLVSDAHDNIFGMRAAARLAAGGGTPVDGVLVAGDVTDFGLRAEAELFARALAGLHAPVVYVGGNHEDAPAMLALSRAGMTPAGAGLVSVAGITVAGEDDPLARTPRIDSDRTLLAADAASLATRWRSLDPKPQVLLVHDLRQAEDTVAEARRAGAPLVVAYGNDHVVGVRRLGSVWLVDAGTAGASGYAAIGSASPSAGATSSSPAVQARGLSTFQLLDFSREGTPRLLAVTTIGYAGDGRTVVEYTPVAE